MIWNYNLETEDNTETFEEHDGAITKILVVNQKYIFSASEDGTIKKWNPKASGTTSEMTYTGHEASVNDIVMLD
jgi:WD40 repeat protein